MLIKIHELAKNDVYCDEFLEVNQYTIDTKYTSILSVDHLEVHLKMSFVSMRLIINGHIIIGYKLQCDRCLCEYSRRSTQPFFHEEEIKALDETINLTPIICEYIISGLPMKSICGKECKGICFTCGQNLNENQCQCEHKELRQNPFLNLDKKF